MEVTGYRLPKILNAADPGIVNSGPQQFFSQPKKIILVRVHSKLIVCLVKFIILSIFVFLVVPDAIENG